MNNHPWPAERIKALRLSLGLTQQELAVYLGLSGNTIVSNWERGCHLPIWSLWNKLEELEKSCSKGTRSVFFP